MKGPHSVEVPGTSETPEAPESRGAAAATAGARLAALWAGARDGLWDWDVPREELRLSPRWKALFGYAPHEVEDRPEEWFRRVHPRDLDELKREIASHLDGRGEVLETEFRMLHKDGTWRWIVCRAKRSEEGTLLAGSLSDVTAAKEAEARLLVEAFHDPLTGLPNKRLFLDRLGLTLARRRQRSGQPIAVLYLDLDRFHTVNDSLGVDAGDDLLVEVTQRLTQLLRLGDTLGRVGGDKFTILLDGVAGPREALAFADDLTTALKRPLHLAGQEVFASCSAGIALSTRGEERPEDLVADAVTAMHLAKEDDTTPYRLFDPEMNAKAKERLRLEADLHHAIQRREFLLHYQPIISLETGRLTAFEALVRWQHPERGMVPPDVFIPIAEETGQILPLGRWVLEEACRQMRAWHDRIASGKDVSIAVNLSARQFEKPDLVDEVVESLQRSGLAPAHLHLEMTESVVMARTRENQERLRRLRELGIKLLIDDFGTGYSSLASLQSFALDALKIDRSFVMGMEFEDSKTEIVRTVLALARSLGLEVVAEGIESPRALEMLRELDCHYGQGYFFSSPMDAESAAAWIEDPPTY